MMQSNTEAVRPATNIGRYLLAGLIAGLVGGIISVVYGLIFQAVSGNSYAELAFYTILPFAIVISIIGALAYYGLNRFSRNPLPIFWGVGLGFAILSIVPNFTSPVNPTPGFAAASSPMHLIVALVCLIIVPMTVKRS